MSLNELAVDLTCDPAEFAITSPSSSTKNTVDDEGDLDAFDEELDTIPGSFPIDLSTPFPSPSGRNTQEPANTSAFDEGDTYLVHGGMLKMARAMGCRGKPVYAAVKHALKQNEGYGKASSYHIMAVSLRIT